MDDPGEQVHMITQEPEQLDAMRAKPKSEVLPTFATPEVERQLRQTVDPSTRKMLKALGYL